MPGRIPNLDDPRLFDEAVDAVLNSVNACTDGTRLVMQDLATGTEWSGEVAYVTDFRDVVDALGYEDADDVDVIKRTIACVNDCRYADAAEILRNNKRNNEFEPIMSLSNLWIDL